jgi:hypothetical protein
MSFQVIIDYDNIFQNNPGLSSGKRGTIFNYRNDIIKIQSCNNLEYIQEYSNRDPYELTSDDKYIIESVYNSNI